MATLAILIALAINQFPRVRTDTEYIGSSLQSAGDMTLRARGGEGGQSGGGVPTPGSETSGNIAILGSDLTAKNITLDAASDIFIESSADTHSLRSENENLSASIGVAFGVGKNSAGFSVFAEGAMGKGHENADGTVHTNSHITAAENLAVTSARDTTIAGATLTGDSVTMDIGRDLTLQSRQDTDTYESEQMQISVKGEGGSGGGGGSLSYSHSETGAGHASVVEQTGIFAGKDGFDITVGNRTSLTGAVIASEADPSKNKLSTQTLDFTDIQNHSEYDAKSLSINISAGSGGVSVSGGMSHQSDSVSGVTRSAIADGDITVRSDLDENGNRIGDSLAGLSRDTASANGSVENIFNPAELAKQQEMAQLIGEVGSRVAGDLTTLIYEKQLAKTDKEVGKRSISDDDAHNRLDNLNMLFGQGGIMNTVLNAGIGALAADASGGGALGGALGGAASTLAKVNN